jgi:hypothetical protein
MTTLRQRVRRPTYRTRPVEDGLDIGACRCGKVTDAMGRRILHRRYTCTAMGRDGRS